MAKDYTELAQDIVAHVGGKDNITKLVHLSLIHISEPTRPY